MKNLLREINCRSLGIFAAKPSSEIWHNKAKKYLSTQKWEKCKSQDGARGKIVDLVAAMPSPEIWQKKGKMNIKKQTKKMQKPGWCKR